jgi:hypothetical protein
MIDEHRSACAEQYISYRQPVSHEASPYVRTQPYNHQVYLLVLQTIYREGKATAGGPKFTFLMISSYLLVYTTNLLSTLLF